MCTQRLEPEVRFAEGFVVSDGDEESDYRAQHQAGFGAPVGGQFVEDHDLCKSRRCQHTEREEKCAQRVFGRGLCVLLPDDQEVVFRRLGRVVLEERVQKHEKTEERGRSRGRGEWKQSSFAVVEDHAARHRTALRRRFRNEVRFVVQRSGTHVREPRRRQREDEVQEVGRQQRASERSEEKEKDVCAQQMFVVRKEGQQRGRERHQQKVQVALEEVKCLCERVLIRFVWVENVRVRRLEFHILGLEVKQKVEHVDWNEH